MPPAYCPICDRNEGLSPCAGRLQPWREPVPVATGVPPEMAHLIPLTTQGVECGHTVSLRSLREHNIPLGIVVKTKQQVN